ncbi:MAG: NAD(P)-dependent oxidoreductase [Spirochaetales bacterium]
MDNYIGFIGLGAMGKFMAENLIKAGYEMVLFDVNVAALKEFEGRRGVNIVSSAAEVGSKVSLAITMLPNSPHVEEAVLGLKGLANTLKAGSTVVDMSTISPKVARKVASLLRDKGIDFLDAPVSGGQKGAREGTLSIMVGGEKKTFESVLPVLKVMGKTIVYVGPSGAGQAVKLCNQVIVGMNIQAICESFALAKAEGLDLEKLREVLKGGAANSWMMENLAPQIIKGEVGAGFRISLQLKDLHLALEEGYEHGVPMLGTALVTNLYLEAKAHGESDNGNQALFKVYNRLANQV